MMSFPSKRMPKALARFAFEIGCDARGRRPLVDAAAGELGKSLSYCAIVDFDSEPYAGHDQ